jgi:hypothetical protein
VRTHRRLPTTILVLATVALLGVGAVWWTRSRPVEPPAAALKAAPSSIVVIQLDNGAVMSYDSGRSTFWAPSQRLSALEAMVATQWPCRLSPPSSSRFGWGRRAGGDVVVRDARVIRLPRCAALTRSPQPTP